MKNFVAALEAWFLAHPAVEHLLESLIAAIVMATYGAIQTGMTDAHTGLTYGAISAAVVLAVKTWAALNRGKVVALLQDQLQAIAANPTSSAQDTVASVPAPTSAALSPVAKMLLYVFAFSFLTTVVQANPLSSIGSVPAGGEDAFILAPIGSVEFNPSTSNNYGLAISESFAFANILPGKDGNHVVVSPYGFVGVFSAANIGQWVATNGGAPWSIDYGLMIGLPKLDDSIPEVAFAASWNTIARGDAKLMINVAFPADLLPSILVHKL